MSPSREPMPEAYAPGDMEELAASPFQEAPGYGEHEWDSPVASRGEALFETDAGEWEAPYTESPENRSDGTEAWAAEGEAEWSSPFAAAEVSDEISPEFPAARCGQDVTYQNKDWTFGKNNERKDNPGDSSLATIPRAEFYSLTLSAFDVDRYHLKPKHREALADLARRLADGVKAGRYTDGRIVVVAYGGASSTAGDLHNIALSRHRAFNALHGIRCEIQKLQIPNAVRYAFSGSGEEDARAVGPDQTEAPVFRRVFIRVTAPLKEPVQKPCNCPPPTPPGRTTSRLCISIPDIKARSGSKIPPDIIPLGPLIPGLRLPAAIVTRGFATVRIEDPVNRQAGTYAFEGWGIEIALPPGKTVIDVRADLRMTFDVLVRASASLAARLQLGQLGLVLKLDAQAFAHLFVKLVAQLRLRLEVDLGRPNVPELTACRPLPTRGKANLAALAGPALMLIPGRGYGTAVLSLQGRGVPALGLPAGLIPVPADKATVKTLLALGGQLRLTSGASMREFEGFEPFEGFSGVEGLDEWEAPYADGELEGPEAMPALSYSEFLAELAAFA